MSSFVHSWPLGGERFISVSGMEGVRRGYTSLVERLTRGHRKGKDIILIPQETSNIRSTGIGKDM